MIDMSWPVMDSGAVLSGADAKTVGLDLYDRALCAKGGGTTWYFATVSETGTSYLDKANIFIRIPECVRSGDLIQVTVLASYSGVNSGQYRAREVDGPTNGTEQGLGGQAAETSEITVPDDTWAGTVKELAVQLKVTTAGTASATGHLLLANVRFKTT